VDVDSGQLKWHYQCTPGDQWDYDAVQHLMLADLRIDGKLRKVVMQANKNGFFYVIDRITGEFISATPFTQVSWATSIDPKTGRPTIAAEAFYSSERGVTVAPVQGHGWAQMAFNPNTGLVYFPATAASTFNFTAAEKYTPTPGAQNFGLNMSRGPDAPPLAKPPVWGAPARDFPAGQNVTGILSAWDPVARKERWFGIGGGPNGGGVLATAGNLVFQVLGTGRLYAYSADKGERLLDIEIGQNGMGPPMTYMLDGKQYIAVMGGQGAISRGLPPGAPAPAGPAAGQHDPSRAAAPPAPAMPKLYVYALPDAE
jgi:glucose dehydrogenase